MGQLGQQSVEPIVEELTPHAAESQWHETILLTVGYLGLVQQRDEAAGELVEALSQRAPGPPGEAALLAGRAVADAWPGGVPPGCRERVVDALLATMCDERIGARRRAEAGRVLADLGDPRAEVTSLDGMHFCLVPAGPFLMGSDESDPEAWDDEKRLHELDIPYDLWIGRYPVTVAQWTEYLKSSAREPGHPDAGKGAANEPAVRVGWEGAVAFCAWLTERWRGTRRIPADYTVRLPSEAEWEKAARGGLRLPGDRVVRAVGEWSAEAPLVQENAEPARRYPWGGPAAPNHANYIDSELERTSAAGCFPGGASPYGAEEMAGNVWEWTRSLWGEDPAKPSYGYPYVPTDGREDEAAAESVLRVVRGGSYFFVTRYVRCAARNRFPPFDRPGLIGFRVVVSPFTSEL